MAGILGAIGGGIAGGAAVTIVINAIDKASGVFAGVNKNMLAMGAGITAAGIAGVVVLGNLAEESSNLAESVNAVNVVFGESAEEILKIGENSAKSFGMSKEEFNSGAVRFSAFAEVIAKDGGTVSQTIETMTARTADFASVMNVELGTAQVLMQAGLAGETEGLRRYGIDVSAATVKTYAYANGIAEAGKELTEQQKITARYGVIMEQTNKFAGDFANTSDDLANAQRILKASFSDVKAELGKALLPIFKTVVGWIQKAVDWFSNLSEGTKKFIIIAVAVGVALALIVGPLLIIIAMLPALAGGLGIVAGALTGVAGALTAVSIAGLPVWLVALLIVAALAAVIAIGYLLIKHWDKVKVAAQNLGIFLSNAFIGVRNVVVSVWNAIVTYIEWSINNVINMVNRLISLLNIIPGVNIKGLGNLDLGYAKGKMMDYQAYVPQPIEKTKKSTTNNINITGDNYGVDAEGIAASLASTMDTKIRI